MEELPITPGARLVEAGYRLAVIQWEVAAIKGELLAAARSGPEPELCPWNAAKIREHLEAMRRSIDVMSELMVEADELLSELS